MFESGLITSLEMRRCIHYLLCRNEFGTYAAVERQLSMIENDDDICRRVSSDSFGFDKKKVWVKLFQGNEMFVRIMAHRRIDDIDHLLYRAWDYYDLDMPGHEDADDELTVSVDNAMMNPVESVLIPAIHG